MSPEVAVLGARAAAPLLPPHRDFSLSLVSPLRAPTFLPGQVRLASG